MIDSIRSKSNLVIATILFLIFAAFIYINAPFILPFVLAGIFALGVNDFTEKSSARLRIHRGWMIAIVTLIGFAIFWIPLTLAIYRGIMLFKIPDNLGAAQFSTQIATLKTFVLELVHKVSTWTGIDLTSPVQGAIENVVGKAGDLLFNFSSTLVRRTPTIIFYSFIFILFFVVLLAQAKKVKDFTVRFSPLEPRITENLIAVLKQSCSVTLFSTFVIGLIQASIIGMASLIFSEGDFWLVTTITFVFAFIPVIGAAPVGYLLALLSFLDNRIGSAVGLAIFATIAGTIDNILKPLLIGGKDVNVSPLVGFTCVVGAIIMMGLPGLLVGPVVMNIFVRATPILLPEFKK